MRSFMNAGLIGLVLTVAPSTWAEEPGVITFEELERNRAIEGNTYHNSEYGFSITKPDEWILTPANDPRLRAWAQESAKTMTGNMELIGAITSVSRFPDEATWVLVNPTVMALAFRLRMPATAEEVAAGVLKAEQAGSTTQVLIPPMTIELNDSQWVKTSLRSKVPWPTATTEPTETELYSEFYFHVMSDELVMVLFEARYADVPTYRQDVDSIIRSIKLVEKTVL